MIKKIFSLKNEIVRDEFKFIVSKHKVLTILGLTFKINLLSATEKANIKEVKNQLKSLKNSINELKRTVFIDDGYVFHAGIPEKDSSKNLELYSGLNDTAKAHLDKIFDINDKIRNYLKIFKIQPKAEYIYEEEDLNEYYKYRNLDKEIENKGEYFQWRNYKLPIRYFESSVFQHKHGIETFRNESIDNKVILDVGGNIGDSVLIFREAYPENKIITFEPENDCHNLLLKTLELNNTQNVIAEKIALGDKTEAAFVKKDGTAGACTKISKDGEQIYMETLDHYVERNNLQVGLIKVDIEGFEQNFLQGAKHTIQEQAPILLLSIYHSAKDFLEIKPLVESFMKDSKYEYEFDFFQGINYSALLETLLICKPRLK